MREWLRSLRRSPRREILFTSIIWAAILFLGYEAIRSPATSPPAATAPATPGPAGATSTPATSTPTQVFAPMTTFYYPFNTTETLYEAGSAALSTSPYWWVNSGSELVIANGVGSTISGSLPTNDPWRLVYAKNNPMDTDDGYHPQNIFRLVTKYEWKNYTEEAYFKIDANNLSASTNRNESNGLLLFNRYQNAFNLYYAGVRVDGNAVIKKKINGVYYTMALIPLFPGSYNPISAPNLIPSDIWIGIRTVVTNTAAGSVSIKLYVDVGKTGNWVLAAQAVDNGTQYGGAPIAGPANLGIRTDFMDVEFEDFRVTAM